MAQRRPITSHPAFVPLVALWFAALFGLAVAVLPARVFAAAGLDKGWLAGGTGHLLLSVVAALPGVLLGWVIARAAARRAGADPRPVYDEFDFAPPATPAEPPARRPLRVREELEEEFADEAIASAPAPGPPFDIAPTLPVEAGEADRAAWASRPAPAVEDGVTILTPQPVHPPRSAPDLEALLAQFDNAIAAFRSEGGSTAAAPPPHRFDPVRAFVARQTGSGAPSPLGGPMPDHQAELRAALEKMARARREE